MRVICPSCCASFSLDVALQMDASRSALLRALQMPAPLAALWAQYLGMFRSKARALAHDRAERLMAELLPMLDAQEVLRNGVTRPAPIAVWCEALEQMVELRNTDKLRLPLKSHGYLLEIVFALADKLDAAVEREREAQLKKGPQRADSATFRSVADVAAFARANTRERIRTDFKLQLLTREEAISRLAAIGYDEEALDAR